MLWKLEEKESCDVYVAGSGIAGIMAAIAAADAHVKVMLSSSTHLFSGSSFYPGTWGLGVVTPESGEDEEDLVQTILRVGCGMADERLVRIFVGEMRPTLAWLKQQGLIFMEAKDKTQRDFIPCFDHKHRNWNGIVAKEARKVFAKMLEERRVMERPNQELVEVVSDHGKICGVIVLTEENQLEYITCKALILATGGYGGLYSRHLTTDDIRGTGQALALSQGAALVNMEFMQMMPGYLSPCTNTIFNERTFRYVQFPGECRQEWLDERSTYGPFTSRFPSREVDFLMEKAGRKGIEIKYSQELKEDMPEFIQTYFTWLKEEKGLTAETPVQIAMFAHAANGGICIDEWGYTGVPGLYACGEVSGGMHGADRIGGLSTVNGFVFGRRAGEAAARAAAKPQLVWKTTADLELWEIPKCKKLQKKLLTIMNQYAFVIRSEEGLEYAVDTLEEMCGNENRRSTEDLAKAVESRVLHGQLVLALGILKAQQMRKESRGSHYRKDYPVQDDVYAQPIILKKGRSQINACWKDA